MIQLYPDQEVFLEDARGWYRRGLKRVLGVAPCGWGKGQVAAHVVESSAKRGRRSLFIVNRREIVKDFSRRLDRFGLDHGIIMANHPRRRPDLLTHVVSIDTIHRRDDSKIPKADFIVIDEAHFATADIWQHTLARYPGVPVLGLTATPLGPGESGLDRAGFEVMVKGPTTAEMIELGRLVPVREKVGKTPDRTGLKPNKQGEYGVEAEKRFVNKQLIGDMVAEWLRHAIGRPTVLFAQGVEHSKLCTAEFVSAGIKFVHVDADTPSEVRDAVWEDLATGRIAGCSNYGITTYGWDVPAVSCVISGRFTENVANFRQMLGRGMRSAPGKDDCLLLDHAGWTFNFGFIEEEPDWRLEGFAEKRKPGDRAPGVRHCGSCTAPFRTHLETCPYCGWEYVHEVVLPSVAAGTLEDVEDAAAKKAPKPYKIKKLSENPVIAHFQHQAEARGYTSGWMWVQYGLWKKGDVRIPDGVYEDWCTYVAMRGAPQEAVA